jgi:hypothetical protein
MLNLSVGVTHLIFLSIKNIIFVFLFKAIVLFQYLAEGVVPVELPTPCNYLDDLFLCMNFNDLKEISAALCLLRSSPNLRKLEISVSTHLV